MCIVLALGAGILVLTLKSAVLESKLADLGRRFDDAEKARRHDMELLGQHLDEVGDLIERTSLSNRGELDTAMAKLDRKLTKSLGTVESRLSSLSSVASNGGVTAEGMALVSPDDTKAATAPAFRHGVDLATVKDAGEAQSLYAGGNYAEAAGKFAAVIERQPENAQARLYYAVSLYKANPGSIENRPLIEKNLLAALQAQGEDPQALGVLARLALERQDWSAALGYFKRLFATGHREDGDLTAAGYAAYYANELGTSRDWFNEAIVLTPENAELRYASGKTLEALGDRPGALARYRECLAVDKDYMAARLRLGIVLKDAGKFAEALEALSRYIAVKGDFEAFDARGEAYLGSGDRGKAMEDWRRAASLGKGEKGARIYGKLTRLAYERGDFEACLSYAQDGKRMSGLPLLDAYLGAALAALGKSKDALAPLNAAFASDDAEASTLAKKILSELDTKDK